MVDQCEFPAFDVGAGQLFVVERIRAVKMPDVGAPALFTVLPEAGEMEFRHRRNALFRHFHPDGAVGTPPGFRFPVTRHIDIGVLRAEGGAHRIAVAVALVERDSGKCRNGTVPGAVDENPAGDFLQAGGSRDQQSFNPVAAADRIRDADHVKHLDPGLQKPPVADPLQSFGIDRLPEGMHLVNPHFGARIPDDGVTDIADDDPFAVPLVKNDRNQGVGAHAARGTGLLQKNGFPPLHGRSDCRSDSGRPRSGDYDVGITEYGYVKRFKHDFVPYNSIDQARAIVRMARVMRVSSSGEVTKGGIV